MVLCSCIAFFPNIILYIYTKWDIYIYIPYYALEIQIHLILITTKGGRYYHYFCFIGEETGIERLSNLPNITMQASGRGEINPVYLAPESILLIPYNLASRTVAH